MRIENFVWIRNQNRRNRKERNRLGTIVPPLWKTGIFSNGASTWMCDGPLYDSNVSTSYQKFFVPGSVTYRENKKSEKERVKEEEKWKETKWLTRAEERPASTTGCTKSALPTIKQSWTPTIEKGKRYWESEWESHVSSYQKWKCLPGTPSTKVSSWAYHWH